MYKKKLEDKKSSKMTKHGMYSIVRKKEDITCEEKMISIDLVTSSTQNEGDMCVLWALLGPAIGLDAGDK